MSRPKEYFYGDVKKWIKLGDKLPNGRMQTAIFKNALADAYTETAKLPNGDLRLKAIDEILIKQTKTYVGVAEEMHYGTRTVQSWVTSFINLVGRKAGY